MKASLEDADTLRGAADAARRELARALPVLMAAVGDPESPLPRIEPPLRLVLEHGAHLAALCRLLA